MSRRQFLKTTGVAAAGVGAAAMGLSGVAKAQSLPSCNTNVSPDNNIIEVWPSNDPTVDPLCVQEAIDQVNPGGTVILKQYEKGTTNPRSFNFGTAGSVTINKDVTLQGEFRGQRKPLEGFGYGGWIEEGTTIKGGAATVNIYYPEVLVGPSFAIKDIIFDEPTSIPIICTTSSGDCEISGCKIVNLKVGSSPYSPYGAFWMVFHGGTTEEEVERITGTLKIKNNFFGKAKNLVNYTNSMMHISNNSLSNLEISGNEMENSAWAGMVVMSIKGYSVITRNKVNKTRSFYYPGNAISVGYYPFSDKYVTNYSYEGGAEVSYNEITVGSELDELSTTNSTGIMIFNYPPDQFPTFPGFPKQPPAPATYVVSNNIIVMHRNYSNGNLNPEAIYIGGAASNVTCHDNVLEGEAQYGIKLSRVLPFIMYPANENSFIENCTFSGNDLSGFTASNTLVYLDQYAQYNYFGPSDGLPGNKYGIVLDSPSAEAGIYCMGNNNHFEDEQFMFEYPPYYPGWTVTPTGYSGLGYVLFDVGSYANRVVALKGPSPPHGDDICNQVLDLSKDNKVPGYNRCEPKS